MINAPVGMVTKYSDLWLIFLLKGIRPEKYKDRVANEHNGRDGQPSHRMDEGEID